MTLILFLMIGRIVLCLLVGYWIRNTFSCETHFTWAEVLALVLAIEWNLAVIRSDRKIMEEKEEEEKAS